ncbi:aromatic ring-opening dioxygenase LigB subunit [Saccharothrix tamanrassetensis]|uniref:Aromatic ring-opening dioxygenase LigB subunit n=1 Tax=Saccharothrix tamanrassetensis TaxID=1051531 RepID=A0A841CVB2_9PSEU|nr:class III extradiol dioxygenase subunit B-like domain-containing protein [Saccharothrix tamanrassetensis]MBB5959957.1 aromatic ring-opening dioxygenase LigB subunit [Saccharothrix tamanrassetensis]
MISRVAVVPHPPLLVPELVGGAVAETAPVRAACLAAARDLAAHDPDWTAVAVDPSGPRTLADASGTFRGFGVDVPVSLSDRPSSVEPHLPLPALVAGWLREHAGARSVRVHLVPPDLPAAECISFGSRLAGRALLVLGDGSHRHGEQAVGRPDDRAATFDEDVRKALATADVESLKGLDPALADELGAQGRAAWQVLAGVPGPWRCSRSEFLAPYGVGYHVAVWEA